MVATTTGAPRRAEERVDVVDPSAVARATVLGALTVVIGLAIILLFRNAEGDATLIVNRRGEDTLPDPVVPASGTAWVLGLVAVAAGGYGLVRARGTRPRGGGVVLAVGLLCLVVATLVWATAGAAANPSTSVVGLLSGAVRRASPLALGALAGVLCERSGVVNIAIEGQLLAGAFAGAVIASASGSLLLGAGAGVVVGVLLGLVLGVLAIRFTVDQIVAATFINIFALGVTSFLGAKVLAENADLNRPGTFRPIQIPLLEHIPVVGPVLFDNTFHVFAMFVLVAVVAFALFRTRWGLRVRAVGEHPSAADTVGVNVLRLRYVAVALGGAVAGFGGTFFSLDSAGRFEENMTAGRGFIALAALIFGRWHPVGALGAALVFGFAEEFQARLGLLSSPIPSPVLGMLPYLATLVVVAGLIGKARAPAADGIPFHR